MKRLFIVLVSWWGISNTYIGTTASAATAPAWPLLVVAVPAEPTPAESNAAREACRLLALCTGQTVPLVLISHQPPEKYRHAVVLAAKHRACAKTLAITADVDTQLRFLKPGEYLLQTVHWQGRQYCLVSGGDEAALQNGVFRLAERLGIRFIHGVSQPPAQPLRLMVPRQEALKGAEQLLLPPQPKIARPGLPLIKEIGTNVYSGVK